jgi:hypothetical protein
MSKQRQYEEEYDDEQTQDGPNVTLLIVAYFAVLAIAVVILRPYHLSMGGIFFAMVGAAIALALLIVLVKFAIRKFQAMNMTVADAYHLAIGYNRHEALEEDESTERQEDAQVAQRPARFIERDPLRLSDTFQPSFHAFLCVMALIVGMRRSGKSTLLLDLVEELASYGLPFVLFDTQGEYSNVVSRDYLVLHPKLVGNAEQMTDIPETALPFFEPLTIEGAYQFGIDVMNDGLQAVVDLKSYGDDDAAMLMSEIVDGVNDWQEARRNVKRVPMMFFLDEAQKWFPQNPQDKAPDVHQQTQTLLEEAFIQKVVERGGKNGLGLVAATQRYSRINKNLLQGQWKFYLQQKEETDLARYKKQGVEPEEAMALKAGEVIAYGPNVSHFTFQARPSHAPHEGRTPDAQALTSYTQALKSGTLPPLAPNPKKASVTTVELAPPIDEKRTTDVQMAPVVEKRDIRRKAEDIDIKVAIALWKSGFNSRAKLAKALDIAENQAGKLMTLMGVNQSDGRMDG